MKEKLPQSHYLKKKFCEDQSKICTHACISTEFFILATLFSTALIPIQFIFLRFTLMSVHTPVFSLPSPSLLSLLSQRSYGPREGGIASRRHLSNQFPHRL